MEKLDLSSMKQNQKELENILNDVNMKFSEEDKKKLVKYLDIEKESLNKLEEYYKSVDNE